jgi:hypothetical protein
MTLVEFPVSLKKLVASLLWGLTTPFFINDYANL